MPSGLKRSALGPISAAIALALAGCSADITRFDASSLGLSESNIGNSAPTPSRPMSGGAYASDAAPVPSGNSNYAPYSQPRAQRPGEVRMSALPEPAQPLPPPSTQSEPRRSYTPPPAAPAPEARRAPSAPTAAKGEMVEVQHGDTLYALSKRYKVSIAELMSANDLKNPNLKPGQKLYLPAGRKAGSGPQKPLARNETVATSTPPPAPVAGSTRAAAPAPAPAKNANWTGTYTVKPGDSLYVIARQHKVQFNELQTVNGITDVHKVRPGTVLKVPEGMSDGTAQAPAAVPPAAIPPVATDDAVRGTSQQPKIINPTEDKQRVAGIKPPTVSDAGVGREEQAAAPSEPSGSAEALPGGKLRWPVRGKVIANFGPKTDGSHNDGVNLSVPLGADVHAAEAGVVAYAGNELKGYGNLILIRHDNGWVTAYAHNDQLLVKRGDKVKRGQIVAKAGKTGTVDQPQVHFELRQGSKPIDPTPHMEKL